jgi:hypothetical protein
MDKQKFKAEANAAIDNIFSKIQKLEQKRDDLNDNLRQKYDKQMAELNKRKTELKEQLENIQQSAEDNWEETKEIFSKSMEHYKAGFAELGNLFK